MQQPGRAGRRVPLWQVPLAIKGLAVLFALCVAVRLLGSVGDTRSGGVGRLVDAGAAEAIMRAEQWPSVSGGDDVSLAALILGPLIPKAVSPTAAAETSASPAAPPSSSADPAAATPAESAAGSSVVAIDSWLYYNHWPQPAPSAGPNVITKPAEATSPEAVAVYNTTGYAVDAAALLKDPLKIKLTSDKPAVLIIHTHSSEAYLPAGTDQYVPSDPYRTQDQTQNIERVGDELAAAFMEKGIAVIHDKGVYDYPSYEGAYNRAYEAIQKTLKKYPTIKIVIDMHRDAIEGTDGSVYKTIAQIGSTTCSQILFVMGTNYSGLNHPSWRENFKLALRIQKEMNAMYPSLAKPIELSQYRYNQQATLGSMIVEIGTTGNTLKESLTAARFFADAAARVLIGLYK